MRKATALSVMLSRISSAMELAQPTNPGERSDAVPSGKGIRAHGSTPRPTAAHMFGSFGPYVLIVAVTCSYYVAIAPLLLGHTDLGWHLAAGDLIRSQGSVPAHEPWSFTAGDTRWYNLSWLWDVVASLLFRYGHFTALILATIFLGGLIAGGLAAICLKSHATPVAACIAVIFACILYPTFAVPDVFLAASPNIATLLFCVAFYGACLFRRHLWIAPLVHGFVGQHAWRLRPRLFHLGRVRGRRRRQTECELHFLPILSRRSPVSPQPSSIRSVGTSTKAS